MGCPTTPLSCLTPSNIFAGVYNPRCGGFGDPSNFQAEQAIFRSQYEELINNYGVDINYYVNGFDLTEMNMLYGEHTTQEYSEPFVIRAYLELQETVSLSRYGNDSDDELTCYVSINDFTTKHTTALSAGFHNQRREPKADDLIEVTSLGCDRPGNRGSKIFRITEALDQDVASGMNPMMGHYTWRLTAKRYETSMETNSPQELGNDQVYDNTFSGKLSSILLPSLTSDEKVYTTNIDTISQNTVYDMNNTDNSVYGEYY